MSTFAEPRLLNWTIATPRGLWYRTVILAEQGVFVTPEVDASTMQAITEASKSGTIELVRKLNSLGRFKKARFLAWGEITAILVNEDTGTIELTASEKETVSVVVPDRERLKAMARVLPKAHAEANAS